MNRIKKKFQVRALQIKLRWHNSVTNIIYSYSCIYTSYKNQYARNYVCLSECLSGIYFQLQLYSVIKFVVGFYCFEFYFVKED